VLNVAHLCHFLLLTSDVVVEIVPNGGCRYRNLLIHHYVDSCSRVVFVSLYEDRKASHELYHSGQLVIVCEAHHAVFCIKDSDAFDDLVADLFNFDVVLEDLADHILESQHRQFA